VQSTRRWLRGPSNSQIPLEYAYAAWDCLPEGLEDDRLLEPFRQVSREQLKAFAAHRVRALAHIEGSFKRKARWVPKPKIHLPSLHFPPDSDPPFSRSLEEFLFMEHHAALQAKLLTYSLSIDRRAQTGLALLLRYVGYGQVQGVHRFAIEFDTIGLDPVLTMNAFRLKEGDWVVINEADPPPPAGKIKEGKQMLGSIAVHVCASCHGIHRTLSDLRRFIEKGRGGNN